MGERKSLRQTVSDKVVDYVVSGAIAAVIGGTVLLVWEPARTWADEFLSMPKRVSFIERYMEPPRVVEWDEDGARQIGACVAGDVCTYRLQAMRTEYGDQCGDVVSTSVTIRVAGEEPTLTDYEDDWTPVRLERTQRRFIVPVVVPSDIPPGDHVWRSRVEYATCPGVTEPRPRFSPWWPLRISDP